MLVSLCRKFLNWIKKHCPWPWHQICIFWAFDFNKCQENDTASSQKLDTGVAWCPSVLMELVVSPSSSSLCVLETLHHNDGFSEHWAAMTSFPLLWPPWPIGMPEMSLPETRMVSVDRQPRENLIYLISCFQTTWTGFYIPSLIVTSIMLCLKKVCSCGLSDSGVWEITLYN